MGTYSCFLLFNFWSKYKKKEFKLSEALVALGKREEKYDANLIASEAFLKFVKNRGTTNVSYNYVELPLAPEAFLFFFFLFFLISNLSQSCLLLIIFSELAWIAFSSTILLNLQLITNEIAEDLELVLYWFLTPLQVCYICLKLFNLLKLLIYAKHQFDLSTDFNNLLKEIQFKIHVSDLLKILFKVLLAIFYFYFMTAVWSYSWQLSVVPSEPITFFYDRLLSDPYNRFWKPLLKGKPFKGELF